MEVIGLRVAVDVMGAKEVGKAVEHADGKECGEHQY